MSNLMMDKTLPGDLKGELTKYNFKSVMDELKTKYRLVKKTSVSVYTHPKARRGYAVHRGSVLAVYSTRPIGISNEEFRMATQAEIYTLPSLKRDIHKFDLTCFFTSKKEAFLVKQKLDKIIEVNKQLWQFYIYSTSETKDTLIKMITDI
jgi:hypothetical protein